MKLNRAEVRFSEKLYPGKLCYYIKLDDVSGYTDKEESVAKSASEFSRVIITGEEPFKQKESIRDFVKYLLKFNNQIKVIIHTQGNIKPIGLNKFGTFDSVKYIVYGQLKNSGLPMDVRVNETSWKFFATAGADFVFRIKSKEDIDEVNMLMAITGIKKHQVHLNIECENFKEICFEAKSLGFNVYIEADQSVFEEV